MRLHSTESCPIGHSPRAQCATGPSKTQGNPGLPLAGEGSSPVNLPWDGADFTGINSRSASGKGRAVSDMLGWTKWAIALAIAGLAMCGASPVRAGDSAVAVQRLGPPEIEARREALLRRMLANPSDLDVAFEYANLSSQVGDYEGRHLRARAHADLCAQHATTSA
jgi:hypothetical protein